MFEVPYIYLDYENILQFFSIPFNLFTLYCILRKTPTEMKEYRVHLVTYQMMTLTFEFILLSMKAELYVPALAGRIFGIWDSVFGIGARHAMGISCLFLCWVAASVIQLFFYKFQSLLDMNSPYKLHTVGYVCYFGVSYLIFPIFPVAGFELLDLQQGTGTTNFQNLIELYPSLHLNLTDIYVVMAKPLFSPYVNLSSITFVACSIFGYIVVTSILASLSIYLCMQLISHLQVSSRTRRMQKKFFLSLCIQMMIPVLAIATPWGYFAFAMVSESKSINSELNNFLFAIVSSHGTTSSISLLLLTQPYRKYILQLAGILDISNLTHSIVSRRIFSISVTAIRQQ